MACFTDFSGHVELLIGLTDKRANETFIIKQNIHQNTLTIFEANFFSTRYRSKACSNCVVPKDQIYHSQVETKSPAFFEHFDTCLTLLSEKVFSVRLVFNT